jgi:hypothetical protein
MWNSLSAVDKKANAEAGNSIVKTLINNGQFHHAVGVWNDLVPVSASRVEEGRIPDGSFEEIMSYGSDTGFRWQVKGAPAVQIGIDPNMSHSGARSLRMIFQVRSNVEGIGVSELVPVARDTTYGFECFVRTEKLNSGGTPMVEIVDAATGAVLVASDAAPNGDNDWTRVELTFKTTAKTEGVTVRIVRAKCPDELDVCPIFGAVWYDDFSFKRLN